MAMESDGSVAGDSEIVLTNRSSLLNPPTPAPRAPRPRGDQRLSGTRDRVPLDEIEVEAAGQLAGRPPVEPRGERTYEQPLGHHAAIFERDAVADDHAALGMACRNLQLGLERLVQPEVVGVQKRNVVARGDPQPRVAGAALPGAFSWRM